MNTNQLDIMALQCCNNTFRTQEAFLEHKSIHTKGVHIFECRKCIFTCPRLYLMVAHNVLHKREMIAVLEEENKLVNKPWFVPNEKNKAERDFDCIADFAKNVNEIQQYTNADDISTSEYSNSDSNGNEDTLLDRESDSDKDDPIVIDYEENLNAVHQNSEYANNLQSLDTSLTCFICDTIFREESLYADHVRKHSLAANLQSKSSRTSDMFVFSCVDCEFKCEDIEEFDVHKKSHYKTKAHTCIKCRRHFKTNSQLQRHASKVHNSTFMCEMCQFQTKHHSSLIRHLRDIHPKKDSLCSSNYSNLNDKLQSNKNSTSNDISKITNEANTVSQLECNNSTSYSVSKIKNGTNPVSPLEYNNSTSDDISKITNTNKTDADSQFECKICKSICLSSSELVEHTRKHKISYKCKLCVRKFKTKEALRYHNVFHSEQNYPKKDSDINIFSCLDCEFECEDIEEYDLHKKSHYKDKAHICKKCSRYFKTKSQLQRHDNKVHKETFMCEMCQFQTKYHPNLKRHLRDIHPKTDSLYSTNYSNFNDKPQSINNSTSNGISKNTNGTNAVSPVECNNSTSDGVSKITNKTDAVSSLECNKSTPDGISKITNNTDDVSQFECKICKFICLSSSELVKHTGNHKKTYKCKLCVRKFKSKEALRYHKVFHIEQNKPKKDFKCLRCEKRFSTIFMLQNHMTDHSDENKFHDSSKLEKNSNVQIRNHKTKHKVRQEEKVIYNSSSDEPKDQKIFICHFCQYQTKSISRLKIHVEDNHPITDNSEYIKTEKMFHCNFCEYKSKVSGFIQKHILEYHKDKYGEEYVKAQRYFHCNFCEYKSKVFEFFKKHISKYHKDEYNEKRKEKFLKIVVFNNTEDKNRKNRKSKISKIMVLGNDRFKKKSFMKLHKCKYCSYNSIHKSSLTKHILTYHVRSNCDSSQDKGQTNIKKVIPQLKKKYNAQKIGLEKDPKSIEKFSCSYCDHSSKWDTSDIRKHMEKNHGIKDGIVIVRNGAENINVDITKRKIVKEGMKSVNRLNYSPKNENVENVNNDDKTVNKTGSKLELTYKKVHRCSICSYTNYRKANLDKHLKDHDKGTGSVINYKCPECFQCYLMKASLISHLKSHIGTPFEKPRICPGCKKSFNTDRTFTFNHIEKCL